jgi:hypothetical protein
VFFFCSHAAEKYFRPLSIQIMIRPIFTLFICHLLLVPAECDHLQMYTNHFVAEINGGEGEAKDLARKYNLRLMPTVRIKL